MSTRGGAANIGGICYQMLRAIDDLRELSAVHILAPDAGQSSACVVLEPAGGGDAMRVSGGAADVIQVKLRDQPLKYAEFVSGVLPDFLRAKRVHRGEPSHYELQTAAGITHQDAWEQFIRRVATGALGTDRVSIGRKSFASDDEFLRSIKDDIDREIKKSSTTIDQISQVLAHCRFADPRTEDEIVAGVDRFLAEHHPDDQIVEKRRSLIGWLIQRAKSGDSTIDISEFRRVAGWSAWSFGALPKLAQRLLHERREKKAWGFDKSEHIPRVAVDPSSAFTLFTGRSGFGKSWEVEAVLQDSLERCLLAIHLPASELPRFDASVSRRVWVEAMGKSGDPSLRALSEKARDAHSVGSYWLTVGIAETLDESQAQALCTVIPQDCGIRVVAAANLASAELGGADRVDIPAFTFLQLHRYLARRGIDDTLLPPDIRLILTTPLFARLFADLDSRTFTPANEYELVGRGFGAFWKRLAPEHRDYLHADLLLDPDVDYPWSQEALLQAGMSHSLIGAFRESGLMVSYPDDRWGFVHDRLLNWYLARRLERRFVAGEIDAKALAQCLSPLGKRPDDSHARPNAQPLLGYVLMDIVWLLRRESEERCAEVCTAWMGSIDAHSAHSFATELLPTLGKSGLALLDALATRSGEGSTTYWTDALIAAVESIGKHHPQEVATFIAGQLSAATATAAHRWMSKLGDFPSLAAAPLVHRRLAELEATREPPAMIGAEHELRRAMLACLPLAAQWASKQIVEDLRRGNGLAASTWVHLLTQSAEPFADALWSEHGHDVLSSLPSGKAELRARVALRFGLHDVAEALNDDAHQRGDGHRIFATLAVLSPARALNFFDRHYSEIGFFGSEMNGALLIHAATEARQPLESVVSTDQHRSVAAQLLALHGDAVSPSLAAAMLTALSKVLDTMNEFSSLNVIDHQIRAISEFQGAGFTSAFSQDRVSALADTLLRLALPAQPGKPHSTLRDSARGLLRRIGGDRWSGLLRAEMQDTRREIREQALREDLVDAGTADVSTLLMLSAEQEAPRQRGFSDQPALAALHLIRAGHLAELLDQSLHTLTRISLRGWHRHLVDTETLSDAVTTKLHVLLDRADERSLSIALAIIACVPDKELGQRIPDTAFNGTLGTEVATRAFFAMRRLGERRDTTIQEAVQAVTKRLEWCGDAADYVLEFRDAALDRALDIALGDQPVGDSRLIDACIEIVRRGELDPHRLEIRRRQLSKMRGFPFLDQEDLHQVTLDPQRAGEGHDDVVSEYFRADTGMTTVGHRAAQMRRMFDIDWDMATQQALALTQANHPDAPALIHDMMEKDPARAIDALTALVRMPVRKDHLRRIGIEVERRRAQLDTTHWLSNLIASAERNTRRNACFIAGFALNAGCDEQLARVVGQDPCLVTRSVALFAARDRARTRHAEEIISMCNDGNAFATLQTAFSLADPTLLLARNEIKDATSRYLSEFRRQQLDELIRRRTDAIKKASEANSWPTL
ncbi:MAG: hypothetical protein IPG63_02285 [Xanthomonadales bacterium]|nr:hypothetical protein [Xanthomonadales bacterium]